MGLRHHYADLRFSLETVLSDVMIVKEDREGSYQVMKVEKRRSFDPRCDIVLVILMTKMVMGGDFY